MKWNFDPVLEQFERGVYYVVLYGKTLKTITANTEEKDADSINDITDDTDTDVPLTFNI